MGLLLVALGTLALLFCQEIASTGLLQVLTGLSGLAALLYGIRIELDRGWSR